MTRARDAEAGLTLIEMLVVLAIVAVMAGVTVLGLGALDRGGRAEAEARRLADRLQLASDTALVAGAPLAMAWNARGYRFLRWDAGRGAWAGSGDGLLDTPHALPPALRLERADGGGAAALLITPDLPQPPAGFRVAGGSTSWGVAFDGFGATAKAGR